MWAMGQQIMGRSQSGTGNSRSGHTRTGHSSHIQSARPQSSSSEVELTSNKAGLGQGITKTIAWETSTYAQQDGWSSVSEQENHSQTGFQSANRVQARGSALYPGT